MGLVVRALIGHQLIQGELLEGFGQGGVKVKVEPFHPGPVEQGAANAPGNCRTAAEHRVWEGRSP